MSAQSRTILYSEKLLGIRKLNNPVPAIRTQDSLPGSTPRRCLENGEPARPISNRVLQRRYGKVQHGLLTAGRNLNQSSGQTQTQDSTRVTTKKANLGRLPIVVIENLDPCIDGGRYAIKRVVGQELKVSADIFKQDNDQISANLKWRKVTSANWNQAPKRGSHLPRR